VLSVYLLTLDDSLWLRSPTPRSMSMLTMYSEVGLIGGAFAVQACGFIAGAGTGRLGIEREQRIWASCRAHALADTTTFGWCTAYYR